MFSATGAWLIAIIAIAGALLKLLGWVWDAATNAADPMTPEYNRRWDAKIAAEKQRKATIWERSKVEREELMAAHRKAMAELKAKQGDR